MTKIHNPDDELRDFDNENRYYFNLSAEKCEIESKINERKKMHHQGDPLRADSNEKKLSELAADLAEINKRLELPYPAATADAQDKPGNFPKVRLPVATQQSNAILDCLKKNGHDPQRIPVPLPGKAGVKKVCWDELCESKTLFSSRSVFDTAWERLRTNGDIKDAK